MQYLALVRRTATKAEFRRTWNEATTRWTFHTTWEVYSMVAWMDWRSFGERDVATAIFAEGIARFDHARLVLSYVDLLLEARDLLQARAALAAAVQRVGGTDADLIWKRGISSRRGRRSRRRCSASAARMRTSSGSAGSPPGAGGARGGGAARRRHGC